MHPKQIPYFVYSVGIIICFLSGCESPSDQAIDLCGTEKCSTSCQNIAYGNCDIREASCQQAIFKSVQCVRGVSGSMPPIELITVDEYRASFEEEPSASDQDELDSGIEDAADLDADAIEADAAPEDASNDETEPTEKTDHFSIALSLLGLLPQESNTREESIEQSIENTLGFYSSDSQNVTIIDRENPMNDDYAVLVLAHEFVHALQDQEVNLTDFQHRVSSSYDSWIAMSCLVEGEAKLYENLAWALLQDLEFDDLYWAENNLYNLKHVKRSVMTSGSPFTAAIYSLKYRVGVQYLIDLWMEEGSWGIRTMYDAPLLSSIYWMLGYRENMQRREYYRLPMKCLETAAPEGFTLYKEDSLGSLLVFAFLGTISQQDSLFESQAAWEDATKWRADNFSVFRDESDETTAVSWRIRFAEPELYEKYVQIMVDAPNGLLLKTVIHDDEIEILASNQTDVLTNWKGTDPKNCPEDNE